LGGKDEPEDVEVELAVKMILRDLLQRQKFVNAGVVDQDVERAEGCLRFRKEPLDFRLVGDVGLHRKRLAAIRADLGDHAIGIVATRRVVHDDRSAFGGQMPGDRRTDALGCTGDYGNFPGELLVLGESDFIGLYVNCLVVDGS